MFIKNIKVFFLLLSIIVTHVACVSNDLKYAESEVENIRRLVKTNQFEQIFDKSSSEFRNSVAKKQFIADLKDASSDIENPKNFTIDTWRFSKTTSHSYITLTYKSNGRTKFISAEEFVLVWENGRYRLYNYSVVGKK